MKFRACCRSVALSRVSVHTIFDLVCCTGRALKEPGPPDRHPDPRTTSSHHSHGTISCPLFVLSSPEVQLLASSGRCSLSVIVSSRKHGRKARTRAPGAREARSYRPDEHLQARPRARSPRRSREQCTEQLTTARSSRTSLESSCNS